MSDVSRAFLATIGPCVEAAANGVHFTGFAARLFWDSVYAEIGAGWYLDRFLYLFGEGLEALHPCLDSWSFLVPPGRERWVIGRNAYGALLVVEEPSQHGILAPVYLLDPVSVRYGTEPDLDFAGLIGNWLPNDRLPGFLDSRLFDAWHRVTGHDLDLHEVLGIKVPMPLGGEIVAENFQIEDLVAYYRTTGPIYADALKVKK